MPNAPAETGSGTPQRDIYTVSRLNQAARQLLEQGDIEEGLKAASAIGDDRLQRQARGTISPESFTHGTSEQRVRWFRTGLDRGTLAACDSCATGTPAPPGPGWTCDSSRWA